MEIIELGGRRAQEVYMELKQRLDSMGLLPDALFSLAKEWQGKKEIPQDAAVTCSVDYGGIEGVYLDIRLGCQECGRFQTSPFITGKSLHDTGAGLDRMHQTAAAVTKAFRGDHRQYANLAQKDAASREDMVVVLSGREQDILLDALLERREKLVGEMDGTEQLLRRMTGSITAYMNTVGERPLHLSNHDKASLAIRDGELAAFTELLPKCEKTLDALLVEAAGRAGNVGRKMMFAVVDAVYAFTESAYTQATRNAVNINDMDRVKFLMENASQIVKDLNPGYYGKVYEAAHDQSSRMESKLLRWSKDEWIAPSAMDILIRAVQDGDDPRICDLLRRDIDTSCYAPAVLRCAYQTNDRHMAEFLIDEGLKVNPGDFCAFDLCVKNADMKAAKLLLDKGFLLENYISWKSEQGNSSEQEKVLAELGEHWQSIHPREQDAAQEEAPDGVTQLGGMSL